MVVVVVVVIESMYPFWKLMNTKSVSDDDGDDDDDVTSRLVSQKSLIRAKKHTNSVQNTFKNVWSSTIRRIYTDDRKLTLEERKK